MAKKTAAKKDAKKVAPEGGFTDHVTREPVKASAVQNWVADADGNLPTEGKVRALVIGNDGVNIPMAHGDKFRNFAISKGSEVILDADVAHSLHRSLGAPAVKE